MYKHLKRLAVAVKWHPHYLKNGVGSFFLFATNHILVIYLKAYLVQSEVHIVFIKSHLITLQYY